MTRAQSRSVVVVGGANLDVLAHSSATVVPATSNPGHASMTAGGVGRNIAENLARLGTPTHLVAAVGNDPLGDVVLAATATAGVDVSLVRRDARSTGTYTAVLDASGELVVAVADMAATDALDAGQVSAARDTVARAGLVVLDGNLAPTTLAAALDLCRELGVPAILEPVSVPKATARAHLVAPGRPLFAITPNRDELAALTGLPVDDDAAVLAACADLHARGVTWAWVRLGSAGSLLSGASAVTRHAAAPARVVDVTGAGDAMLAAFCHFLLAGRTPQEAVDLGHAAAALTIASDHTVRPDLTADLLLAAGRMTP